jgi:glycosyl transferase family 2
LLPVRDGEEHLAESISSVEEQAFPDFEVVALDDGSTDDTYEILHAWASRDSRVRVSSSEAAGIVPALERGRGMAQGRYLARMDADDISEPGRFGAQFELMELDPALAIVGCDVEYFPRDHVRAGALRYERWLNTPTTRGEVEREIFVECPLAHPSFFMRSDRVQEVGGYRDMGWAEDYDLVFRLWRAGGGVSKVPDRLLRWREGPDRLSRTDARYSLDSFRSCRVHHLVRAFPHVARGVAIWGAGPVGKALSRALAEEGVPVRAFAEVDPKKIGQNIHGAQVLDTPECLALTGVFHLGAVGQPGVREQLRGILSEAGFEELENFALMA